MAEFVRIQDPENPGDYLVLAKREFDPSKHELFVEGEAAPESQEPATTSEQGDAPAPKKAPKARR